MSKKTLRTVASLAKHQFVSSSAVSELEKVAEGFSIAITPQMQQLIDKTNPQDPIAKQFIPDINELTHSLNENQDPIGDQTHTKVKGIVHRYADRCLFMPVLVCPVYCRFCFRKEKVGTSEQTLTPEEIEAAFSYIAAHQDIWEVIFTGGDPFILKPAMLKAFLQRLKTIDHVDIIRIHTRVPMVDSARINDEMISALQCGKPVFVMIHANHPNEFTPEAIGACARLVDAGIPLLSQTVLLKDINDNIDTLSQLMRCFIKNRIKPYYLHQGDLALGTGHFRTSIAKGQELVKQLWGRFSGLCQPTYVLDIPGGHGKSPIHSSCISVDKQGDYQIEDYQGNLHTYIE